MKKNAFGAWYDTLDVAPALPGPVTPPIAPASPQALSEQQAKDRRNKMMLLAAGAGVVLLVAMFFRKKEIPQVLKSEALK